MINRYDPVMQFCVSFVTINIVEVGIERVVVAWNAHPIGGRFQLQLIIFLVFILKSMAILI